MKKQLKTNDCKRFSRVLIIFLMITLTLISFVSAQSTPFTSIQLIDEGLSIDFIKITIQEQNKDFQYNFHVFNTSNGIELTNSTTNCTFHLFNSSGVHVIQQVNIPFDVVGIDWQITVLRGNFSKIGEYAYLVDCQSTENLGGSVSVGFEVTSTGFDSTTPQAIMYGIVLFILLVLFLGSFIWFIDIQWGHYTNNEGVIIEVNKERTKKIILFFTTYVLGLLLIFTGKSMANNFMLLNDTSVFFNIFFDILLISFAPVLICVIVLAVLVTITDIKLQEAIFSGWE